MKFLGAGGEGQVYRVGGQVEKHFYPEMIHAEDAVRLETSLKSAMPWFPQPSWKIAENGQWIAVYDWFDSGPVDKIGLEEAREFLHFCLERQLVCLNIKHENFRRRLNGQLTFIDISYQIQPMHVSYFRDSAARVYCLSALRWSDDDIKENSNSLREPGSYEALPGFVGFYRDILETFARKSWAPFQKSVMPTETPAASNVSLVVKACAMDAPYLGAQLRHIVHRLQTPRRFAEVILLIDSYLGPFLRQHNPGDVRAVIQTANEVLEENLVDRVLIAPNEPSTVREVNHRWFSLESTATHNVQGIPVSSQLWGFEQVRTRYVLQCDIDVLIGRTDPTHDYLAEMLEAIQPPEVFCVGFNIPKQVGADFRPYDAPPGAYVPEVRCGLLDLERIISSRPLPNSITEGRPELSWYRSLERLQKETGKRSLRGGDPRSWYIHPPNVLKCSEETYERIRCLVEADQVPDVQRETWDVAGTSDDWQLPTRTEDIVFLLKGRNTPKEKLERCAASLAMQDDQAFGLVLIDDASTTRHAPFLPAFFKNFEQRVTVFRRTYPLGRIPNFITGISEICTNPETHIVILDLDDALYHRGVVSRLKQYLAEGYDAILGAMFRPDKPVKLYSPVFTDPRGHWGGDVWIHLRSFKKRLFDSIPHTEFQIEGQWIPHCTDYATMIPIVERSQKPIYLPEYLYFHERSTIKTPELQREKDKIIRCILSKPSFNGRKF